MNPMTLTPQLSLNEKSLIVFIYEPYLKIIFPEQFQIQTNIFLIFEYNRVYKNKLKSITFK